MRRGALRAALLAAIALAVATAGCRKEVTGLDSDNSALVYGTVSDSRGHPVDSATVRTTAYSNLCGSRVAVQSETLTDSAGHYSDTLLFFRERVRGCLAVEAIPPAHDDLSTARVEISTRSIWSPGIDSVQLDLTLDTVAGSGATP